MAERSSIEWTEATWNPVTGCTKVSPGCKRCYAERLARRLQKMGNPRYRNGFRLTLHPDLLDLPIRWRDSRMIFVCSMSDLFHEDVPESFIRAVFETMVRAEWHIFQVLTKRIRRAADLAPALPWPPNVWMGTSIENQDYAWRADFLRRIPAAVRFVSVEPLLGPLELDLTGIHWVIVGGESGPGARPLDPAWVRGIRDRCLQAGVAFFFKQWGGITDKRGGRQAVLDGQLWHTWPRRPYKGKEKMVSSGHPLPARRREACTSPRSTRYSKAFVK